MEEENGTTTAAEGSAEGAASGANQVTDDFEFRSPAQIEAAGREAEESTEEEVVEEVEEAAADADDKSTTKATTSQGEDDKSKTAEAPSKEETTVPPLFQAKEAPKVELPLDENGAFDPAKLPQFLADVAAAAKAEAKAEIEQRVYVSDEMEKVETAYPQLKADPSLMDMAQKLRSADVLNGGKGDLLEAAKEIVEKFNLAEQKGKESQKVQIRRQKSARLETAGRSNAQGDNAKLTRLTRTAFYSNNRAERDTARLERLKMLRDTGALNA